MARADLLKRLLRSYKHQDDQEFNRVAQDLISEERKKHHVVLANELEKILTNGTNKGIGVEQFNFVAMEPIPKDIDRRMDLLDVRRTERNLTDLVLGDINDRLVRRVITEFRQWDILESNGLLPVRRVLFCGPSGCGKTATAEAISTELGLPLMYVRFDAVISSLLGETASNIRKVFDFAQHDQWVMLFDEFDAIGRSRDDATEHGEIKRVVNSFLQIMDSFKGKSLIIAATNFERSLDPAVWRRFDDVIRFERPTLGQIKLLIDKKIKPLVVSKRFINTLAGKLESKTFADVEMVCMDIRKSCALRGDRKIKKMDLDEAFERHDYRWGILSGKRDDQPTVDED